MKYYTTSLFSRSRTNISGYTLVELCSIIIIISIISISALPKFFDSLTFTSKTYFDDVIGSVRYAQKLAVAMSCDIQVSVTSNSISLNLRDGCDSGNFTTAIRDPAFGDSSFVRTAPADVSVSATDLPIYFDSMGRAKDSTTGAILSSNATITIDTRVVNIVGETGFAYES